MRQLWTSIHCCDNGPTVGFGQLSVARGQMSSYLAWWNSVPMLLASDDAIAGEILEYIL